MKLSDPTAFQTPSGEEDFEQEDTPENLKELQEEQRDKTDKADEFGDYDPRKDGI